MAAEMSLYAEAQRFLKPGEEGKVTLIYEEADFKQQALVKPEARARRGPSKSERGEEHSFSSHVNACGGLGSHRFLSALHIMC